MKSLVLTGCWPESLGQTEPSAELAVFFKMPCCSGQMLLLCVGVLALLVGSFAPFWLTGAFWIGLWYGCDGVCGFYPWILYWESYTVWFYVVHALTGMATLLAIILLFVCLCSTCRDSEPDTTAGVLGLMSGLLGTAGAVVFFVKPKESMQYLGETPNDPDEFKALEEFRHMDPDWASYVFISGAGLMCIFGIILLLCASSKNNSVEPL